MSQNSLLKKLMSGTAVVAGGRLLGVLANFLLAAVLARLLAPKDMGTYFLAFSLANVLCIIARVGCEQAALKIFADRINGEGSDRLVVIARKFLVIVGVASVSVAVAVFLLREAVFLGVFGSQGLYSIALWFVLWTISLAIQSVVAEVFRAFKDFWGASLFRGPLAAVLTVAFLGAYLYYDFQLSLMAVLQVIVCIQMIVNIAALILLWRKLHRFDRSEPAVVMAAPEVGYASILGMAWPLCINLVAMCVVVQSDLWILQALGNETMVAHYGAASRLVLLSSLALQIANAVVPPYISQLRLAGDIARMQQVLRFVATVAAVPAVVVAVVFGFWGREVLTLVFGPAYAQGATVLILLTLGQLVNVLVGSCGYLLVMYGKAGLLMRISLVSGAISILSASAVLKLGYGMEEVALCYMLVMWGQQLSTLLLARRISGVYTHAGVFSLREKRIG